MARARYLAEIVCALGGACLAALTFAVPNWIEVVFGRNPDGGSGLDEAAIVVVLALISVVSAVDVFRLRRLARSRAAAERA